MEPIVFAAAPYFNSAPLTEGLSDRDDVAVIEDVPSALLDYIRDGRADVGLLPVVDILVNPDLTMVDGLGVCADGCVRSVVLCCHRPLAEVNRVAADPESHTSNMLAQLLLRVHLGSDATVVDDGVTQDAAVIIGDRAMTAAPGQYATYDLAETWKDMTGLPFVFAVWAYRRDNPRAAELESIAIDACRAGESAKHEIAARFSKRLSLPLSLCDDYLASCVYYQVGDREKRAIHEFARLLGESELLQCQPLVEEQL
jgi:chorismate dehydratase